MNFHALSTCRRVRGVQKIRVIDASIMPVISNANLNAPTIMIGEKGASLLIQEWQ